MKFKFGIYTVCDDCGTPHESAEDARNCACQFSGVSTR